MEKKSFGVALVLWFFLGGLGAHRVYIKDSYITLLYYWIFTVCTLGLVVLIDAFLIKGMIEREYMKQYFINDQEEKILKKQVANYMKEKEEVVVHKKIGF